MNSKTYVCLMLFALFLFGSISSFKLYDLLDKKHEDNKIPAPHKLTVKEVDDQYEKLILKDKRKKEEIEKKNSTMNPLTNCVKFFAKLNYQGEPILTLCDNVEPFSRLAVEAENPLMKDIKSFKMAKDSYVTINYTYKNSFQTPMKFFESVENLKDSLAVDNMKDFVMNTVEIKGYA